MPQLPNLGSRGKVVSCFEQLLCIADCENGVTAWSNLAMKQEAKLETVRTVAVILEREIASTVMEWLARMRLVPALTSIPLNDVDRTLYLPKLFADVLCRLRLAKGDEPSTSIIAAVAHGRTRFMQGYSVAMLVEESRLFEVSTFGTLHRHWRELDQNQVLSDVMIIADEADRQLTEAVRSFMSAQAAAA
jgi:hypothetical protein